MLAGRYQESGEYNTSQVHSNRDTREKREEVMAPSEDAGPRMSSSRERDIYGSRKQFQNKPMGRYQVTQLA